MKHTNGRDPLPKTYEMAPDPPAMMGWDDYETKATAEWQALLNSIDGRDERRIHDFLVKHPCWVPGARGVAGASQDPPRYCALLSQSALREWVLGEDKYRDAAGTKIPDFIWLARDSESFFPVLIQIESPTKKWFTDSGETHYDLMQAVDQLAKWRAWLNRPENLTAFCTDFGMPHYRKTFRPGFVLVYGRRNEYHERPELHQIRSRFEQPGQVIMTFDRLKPARDCEGYPCATKTGGRYRVLAVPPRLRFGPMVAREWRFGEEFPEAIMANEWISPERKQFLVQRLTYWDRWGRKPEPRITRVDWEDWE